MTCTVRGSRSSSSASRWRGVRGRAEQVISAPPAVRLTQETSGRRASASATAPAAAGWTRTRRCRLGSVAPGVASPSTRTTPSARNRRQRRATVCSDTPRAVATRLNGARPSTCMACTIWRSMASITGAILHHRSRDGGSRHDRRADRVPVTGLPHSGRMRKWLPLVAICTGTFMLLIDVTIVNVALPDMATDLQTSFGQLQWVVDVYALALAALVLGAGSLADLFGRRKLYLVGLVLFAVASLACGLAPNAELLIVARGVQGIGGAAMLATTIALINTSYDGRDRGTAFGVWGAVVGAAAALGPILGGALTELSWRWIFFVNLPISVFAVVVTLVAVQEARQPQAPRPDVAGIALFTLGAGGVVFGLVRAAADGWRAVEAWGPLGGGLAVLAAWVLVERSRRAPMLDVSLFANRSFTGIMVGAML